MLHFSINVKKNKRILSITSFSWKEKIHKTSSHLPYPYSFCWMAILFHFNFLFYYQRTHSLQKKKMSASNCLVFTVKLVVSLSDTFQWFRIHEKVLLFSVWFYFLLLVRKGLYPDVPNQNPFSDIYVYGDIQLKPIQNMENMRKMAILRYRYVE